MRIAYADPPYPGTAHRYPEKKEVNHRLLIAHLQEFDGWVLSTGTVNLYNVLPICPGKIRIAAWCKTFSAGGFPNSAPGYMWEPVLFKPARVGRTFRHGGLYDWVVCHQYQVHRQPLFNGAKPDNFSFWLFGILRAEPDDEFIDIFPGSGAVTRAWEAWKRQIPLFSEVQEVHT